MFVQPPRLTIDLIMPIATETSKSWSDFVQRWKEQMKEAYHLALKHSDDKIQKMYHRTTQKDHV